MSSWERVIKLENGSKKLFDRLLREHKHLLATADISLFRSIPPTSEISTIYKYGGNRCSNILLQSTLPTLIEVAIDMTPTNKILSGILVIIQVLPKSHYYICLILIFGWRINETIKLLNVSLNIFLGIAKVV